MSHLAHSVYRNRTLGFSESAGGRKVAAGHKPLQQSGLQAAGGSIAARALLGQGASEYRAGRPAEALPPLLEACQRLKSLQDTDALLDALLLCGRAERDLGQLENAGRHFQDALEMARTVKHKRSEVDALNLQAGLVDSQGDHFAALGYLEQALSTAEEAGMAECHADILNNMGDVCVLLGDYARALDHLETAREKLAGLPNRSRSEAINLINLGRLHRDMGNSQGARESYARARELGRELDDRMVEVACINALANTFAAADEWLSARELFHEALMLARRLGLRKFELDNLDGIGQAHATLGEHQRAIAVHKEALRLSRQTQDRENEGQALLALGHNYLATAQLDQAIPSLIEAYGIAVQLAPKDLLIKVHRLLGIAYEQKGDVLRALRHERESHSLQSQAASEIQRLHSRRLMAVYASERACRDRETKRLELHREAREEAEARVVARTRELSESQMEIVARLAIAAEHHDDETGEHTRRVGQVAGSIATILGMPEGDAQLISRAARLHDIGKIGIPDAILLKPGKLTAEEFQTVKAHTTIGASILAGGKTDLMRMARVIALSHHERWDGAGYPSGLAGEEIPVSARIVALADTFDALLQKRPYKPAWSHEEAVAEILQQSGKQFDPQVVAAFKAIAADLNDSQVTAAP